VSPQKVHNGDTIKTSRRTREDVIPEIRDVFRRLGYDGTSLTAISEATGLGRASLYHHFPGGKDEMVGAALDDVEVMMDGQVIAELRRNDRPPAKRLKAMMDQLTLFHEGGRAACLCGVLALTAPALRPRVRTIFGRWLDALADLAHEAGRSRSRARAAAEEALARIEGALILAAAQGNTKPFQSALRDLPRVLFGAPGDMVRGHGVGEAAPPP
jgi:TetR/AcrR family transcriptional repressor of lmrAB and yxaGH operons